MPFLAHSLISEDLIARDAFVMSGVASPTPEQNNFRPPPEPVDSTLGVRNLVDLPKRSATTVENGYTVDEPTMLM